MTVPGTCDDRFGELAELLEASIAAGEDLGASVAVSLDGEMAVDIHGGWADEERTKPWQPDTLVNVWSNTKTMAALAALVLVDRGELDVFAPVAKYWPQFAANGKGHIEVRHLLSHTSGVAGWDMPVTMTDVYDARRSVEMLAAQAPWWEPGTAAGYHVISYGHLISEVVRRITGQNVGQFVASEIAGPLGADFHIGLHAADDHRVSPLVLPPPVPAFDLEGMDHDSVTYKVDVGAIATDAATGNSPEWRRSQICAGGNGHGNARSLTTIQSIVSHEGAFGGVRLLSPKTCELIFREQSKGIDLYLDMPICWGIGYALSWPMAFPYLPEGRVCFWAGWGGSMVINDLDRRMTFSYVMNKMEGRVIGDTVDGVVGGRRSEALIRATYSALNVPLPA